MFTARNLPLLLPFIASRFVTSGNASARAGWRALLCGLILFAVLCGGASQAWAQNTYTVTRFDDTASAKDLRGLPGLGQGNAGDLRYGIQEAIAAGGEWTIDFASNCTLASPCTIALSNPLPPIESGADVVTESQNGWDIGSNPVYAAGTITAKNQPGADADHRRRRVRPGDSGRRQRLSRLFCR